MTSADDRWTVRRLLEWTAGFFASKQLDAPRLSAELLLSHVLNYPRIKLYTDYERTVIDPELGRFRDLVKRAAKNEPIGYLTGRAQFFGLEFEVCTGVLIPRPETETLVENVLQFIRHQSGFESPRVLDLCTGSGCVAAAIATNVKSAAVVATDIADAAIACAKINFDRLKLSDRITLLQGDLFDALENLPDPQPFDLILANPPYIARAQIAGLDANVRDYEPLVALDGGPDGLDPHRRILAGCADRLTAQGRIYLEIAYDHGEAALQLANDTPTLTDARLIKDLGGRHRVLTARKADLPAAD